MVFRALTDEKELVRWMSRRASMEARVGGGYELDFYWGEKDIETKVTGRIVELVPDRKIVYTFNSNRDAPGTPPSLLTWSLEEGPDGRTRVTLVHSGIDATTCLTRSLGWGFYLERLAGYSPAFPPETRP